MFYRKEKHTESEIYFKKVKHLGTVVTKRYKRDTPWIQWLNKQLSTYYPMDVAMPIAQHEYTVLQLLSPFDIAPAPIALLPDAVVMKYAGLPLTAKAGISLEEYRKQCQNILDIFQRLKFKHNDLLCRNVLIDNGKVMVVDFTMSEFNDIKLMDKLPDPKWAQPDKDHLLLQYLEDLQNTPRSGFLAFLQRFNPLH